MSSHMHKTEKSIIANIDNLINIIIKMSQAQNQEENRGLQEAEKLIAKTNPLLLLLLDGKEELLEQMYRQLIFQKLPSPELLKSFGNFESVLQKVFLLPVFRKKSGLPVSTNSAPTSTFPENEAEYPDVPTVFKINKPKQHCEQYEEYEAILERFIHLRYPEEEIIKGYYLGSTKINYFLPMRKLAILFLPHCSRIPHSLSALIHRGNLTLLPIMPQELRDLHLLSRKFSGLSSSQ